jgi:ferredoxin
MGRCPTHARSLSKLLTYASDQDVVTGQFSEALYPRVKQLAESCPVKAILIEKIDE